MLIATAGHIDHGKTALVRALSGVETDRLPEEKARGISIDLGFAYWRPDQGPTLGVVDVPGHERFVRNMIAGLSGIDFVLLVVAADDGVMPQTVEHLQVLDLLGVSRGLVAISKIDRVEVAQVERTRRQVAELLAPTGLVGAGIFALSAQTGEGVAELASAIIAARDEPVPDHGHGFRLAIDRAFSVTGAGTVVTGTVVAGSAAIGDILLLSPTGREVRVRGMQSAGRKIEHIGRGERCALNLSGIEVSELHRGDWLLAPSAHAPCTRIEARFVLLPGRKSPLRHDSQVHLHHGTAHIGARILMPRQRAISPGSGAIIQLVLDAPTSAVSGERFVLRDQSARELLGGGTVLDPLASERRRRPELREAHARAMALTSAAEKLAALAAAPGIEPDVHWLALACNLTDQAIEQVIVGAKAEFVGKDQMIAIAKDRFARLKDALVAGLGSYHREHAGEVGMKRLAARFVLGEPVSADLFASLLASLIAEGRVEAVGALLRLPGHCVSFSKLEDDLWRNVLDWLDDDRPEPIVLADVARELRIGEAAMEAMLNRRSASGDVWKITDTRFMLPRHVAQLVALAAEIDATSEAGFTAGQLRDASGLGRNFIILLLEFFDRIGVTRRIGERRRMRPGWQAVIGMDTKFAH